MYSTQVYGVADLRELHTRTFFIQQPELSMFLHVYMFINQIKSSLLGHNFNFQHAVLEIQKSPQFCLLDWKK